MDSIDDSVLVVAAAAAIAVVVALDLELKKLIALGAVDAALLKDVSVNGDDLAAVRAFDVVILLVVVIAAIVAVAAVVEILIDIALKLVKILVNSVKLLGDEINAVLKVATERARSSRTSIIAFITLVSGLLSSRLRPSARPLR